MIVYTHLLTFPHSIPDSSSDAEAGDKLLPPTIPIANGDSLVLPGAAEIVDSLLPPGDGEIGDNLVLPGAAEIVNSLLPPGDGEGGDSGDPPSEG